MKRTIKIVAMILTNIAIDALLIWLAYMERGCWAVGGEWLLIVGMWAVAGWVIWASGEDKKGWKS